MVILLEFTSVWGNPMNNKHDKRRWTNRHQSVIGIFCYHHIGIFALTHLPWCHIYASLKWVIIGLDNGLSSIRLQAIIETSDDFYSITPQATDFQLDKITKLTNCLCRNIACHLYAILSKGTWVNSLPTDIYYRNNNVFCYVLWDIW